VLNEDDFARVPAEARGNRGPYPQLDPQAVVRLLFPESGQARVDAVRGDRRVEQLEPGDAPCTEERAGPGVLVEIPAGEVGVFERRGPR